LIALLALSPEPREVQATIKSLLVSPDLDERVRREIERRTSKTTVQK